MTAAEPPDRPAEAGRILRLSARGLTTAPHPPICSAPSLTTAEQTSTETPSVGTDDKAQYEPVQGRPLEVKVDERGVERAIRKLRRLMASEGVLREIKRRRHYEKPSVKMKRKLREAERRRKRRERKKAQFDHR